MSNNDLPRNKCNGQHHSADDCCAENLCPSVGQWGMTDPHRKMAEEIEDTFTGQGNKNFTLIHAIEDALRTTSEKAYLEGWNKAVEECTDIAYKESAEHCSRFDINHIGVEIRKLRKPEGMGRNE